MRRAGVVAHAKFYGLYAHLAEVVKNFVQRFLSEEDGEYTYLHTGAPPC
jgi:hypothetical protein